MAPNRYPLEEYRVWVHGEVTGRPPHEPNEHVSAWQRRWRATDDALIAANAIFELLALVVARWEFLGGLYRGEVDRTGAADAIAYSQKFLEPERPHYAALHDLSGRGDVGSDFFTMLRNKPLHGMTPAATACVGGRELVAWWVGVDGIDANNHLTIDPLGKLHVSGRLLSDDLTRSLDRFREHLVDDRELDGHGRTPKQRWRRAFWSRFRPTGIAHDEWIAQGVALGIPA